MCHHKQIHLPDSHKGQNHNQHRRCGIPPAPKRSRQNVVDTVEQQERKIGAHKQDAESNHPWVRGEQRHRRGCKAADCQNNCSRHPCRQANRGNRSPAGPPLLPCADILADKGGRRHGKALHGQKHKLVQLVVCAPSRHTGGAESIDIGLNKHIGHGGDNALNARRKAHLDNLPQNLSIDFQGFPVQPVDIPGQRQQQQGKPRRDKLGDDGGIGHTCNPRLQPQNKEQIQYDIQNTGQHQIIQGSGGVPHCPQNTAAHIVNHQPGKAADINPQINRRLVKHVLRRGHQAKHGVNTDQAHHREQHRQNEGTCHCGLNGNVKILPVVGAKAAGNHHTGTGRESIEEENHDIDYHSGGPYGGQCLGTYIIPHHHRVHGVIEHLKNIAQHQRQRKGHQLPNNGALSHIPCS